MGFSAPLFDCEEAAALTGDGLTARGFGFPSYRSDLKQPHYLYQERSAGVPPASEHRQMAGGTPALPGERACAER